MTTVTEAELERLRSTPHETTWHLSIFEPRVVLAAQVDTWDNTREIEYQLVSAGDPTDVQEGMTMLLGTSPGASDKGKVRVKSLSDPIITVAENSLPLEIGDYLTVIRFWEIWPVFPRYVLDHDNLTVTAYKDYDVAYTDQNAVLGTYLNLGPHRAAFRDPASGEATVFWSATGTYNVKGDSLTYEWFFEGGTPTGSSSQYPGNVVYDTAGHYVTKLVVGNSSGGEDVAYRHISIYDRPGQGPAAPIQEWGLVDLSGDRDTGGWRARLFIRQNISQLVDNALVVIFTEDVYGGVPGSLGGNHYGASNILFCGWVQGGSITYNYQDSVVEFEAVSPTEVMKDTESFSVSVESVSIPANWFEVADMNVEKAIYHYLRWHSTVLTLADVEFRGQDQLIQYFDADRESLYDAVNTLMDGALWGSVVSDRQGKLWSEVNFGATINATGSVTQMGMSLGSSDWRQTITIEERGESEVSWVEFGGVQWAGPGNDPIAIIGSSPGDAPGSRGRSERRHGFAVSSQAYMRQLVGNVRAWENARFPHVEVQLAGNYRNFDIAPQERILVSVNPGETQRGIHWDFKPFGVQGMMWEYDPGAKAAYPTLDLHEITAGPSGSAIVVPVNTDDFDDPIPPIQIPPFPFPDPGPIETAEEDAALLGCKVGAIGLEFDDGGCGATAFDGQWNGLTADAVYTLDYANPTPEDWLDLDGDGDYSDDAFNGFICPLSGVYMLAVEMIPCRRDGIIVGGFVGGDDIGVGYAVGSPGGGLPGPSGSGERHSSAFVEAPDAEQAVFTKIFVFGALAGWHVVPYFYIDSTSGDVEQVAGSAAITLLFRF